MRYSTLLAVAFVSFASAAPFVQIPLATPAAPYSLPSLASLSLTPTLLSGLQEHISSLPERRLVKLSEDSAPIEISEGEKALLYLEGRRFIDVTDEQTFLTTQAKEFFPSKVR